MSKSSSALTSIPISSLPKIAEGKVRELYEVDSKTLLFVATDRISVYDFIVENGIPFKGAVLNLLSAHWFNLLPTLIPNLRTHFLSLSLPSSVSEIEATNLRNRSMQVRRLTMFPIEAIVRGYITGSAWKEYSRSGTVHTIPIQLGLKESEAFPQGPIYTPSTKEKAGTHDVNISPSQAAEIVGEKYAERIKDLAISLYTLARDYAFERGIIIADTKFEFGLDEETDELVLVDEVLTPDSSRFWPKDKYMVGREQESYDKQFLRDWITSNGLKDQHGVIIPEDVVEKTGERYIQAFEKLTGRSWAEAVSDAVR